MSGPKRHYSDKEVALILRRAVELQDRPSGTQADEGLSLETIRDIAREIGLEPALIDQAAASLVEQRFGAAARLLGGPVTLRLEDTYAKILTGEEQLELLGLVRRVLNHHGKVNDVLGAVEWKSTGAFNQVGVTVSPSGDGTTVQVIGDRSETVAIVGILSLFASLGIGGIIVDALQPGTLGMLGILGTAGATGLATARTIWSRTTRAFRRRLEKLRSEIARMVTNQTDSEAPSGSPD